MPDIPAGHDSPIGTYEGLRVLSQTLNLAVRNLDKVSIAAVNGVAIQTGLSPALSRDFRIALDGGAAGSGDATVRVDAGRRRALALVQLLGVAKTMDFLMRNRIASGQEAADVGLVHEAVARSAHGAGDGAGLGDGGRASGGDAVAQAERVQRGGSRRSRIALDDIAGEDGDIGPPPGRA